MDDARSLAVLAVCFLVCGVVQNKLGIQADRMIERKWTFENRDIGKIANIPVLICCLISQQLEARTEREIGENAQETSLTSRTSTYHAFRRISLPHMAAAWLISLVGVGTAMPWARWSVGGEGSGVALLRSHGRERSIAAAAAVQSSSISGESCLEAQ